ncbi:MAG: hemolysin III family protein [bacterium]
MNATPLPLDVRQEIANIATHGIGVVMAVAGVILLVITAVIRGTAIHIVACSVYGATLVLLYLASTLYHSIPHPRIKSVLHVVDHCAIFLLIAGSYTPFALVTLHGIAGWSLFGIVWGIALVGVILKLFLTGRFHWLSSLAYLGMGWLVLFFMRPLLDNLHPLGVFWLAAGGIAYSVGVLFYMWTSFSYSHAIWHVFVMTGSACHYIAVILYVLPR